MRCKFMSSSCSFLNKHSHRVLKAISFLFLWLLGLGLGMYFAMSKSNLYISLMRSVLSQPVSIVGLLGNIFLPLLLTIFLFASCKPVWFFVICFYKAVSYGFSGMLLTLTFGSAGWLFRMLFLFSDTIGIILLFWFWLRRAFSSNKKFISDAYTCLCAILITAGFDRLFIFPLIAGLL